MSVRVMGLKVDLFLPSQDRLKMTFTSVMCQNESCTCQNVGLKSMFGHLEPDPFQHLSRCV